MKKGLRERESFLKGNKAPKIFCQANSYSSGTEMTWKDLEN